MLWIFTVCCDDSCARKFFPLGEHDEIMAGIPLFLFLLWCHIIILIVMCIEDQCLGQFLATIDQTHLLLATKVHCRQVDIHFSDTQQECKDLIGQIFHCPTNLQTDRWVSFIVVIINRVAVQEVVSHHFRIVECCFSAFPLPSTHSQVVSLPLC